MPITKQTKLGIQCRSRALVAALLSMLLVLAGTWSFPAALAEDIDTNPQPDEFQQRIESSATAYNDAMARVDELQKQIDENAQAIAELEEKIPLQKERASSACVDLYKAQQDTASILDLILSSESLSDFITRVDYFNAVTRSNLEQIESLSSMQDQLLQAQDQLNASKQEAADQAEAAQAALQQAQNARIEAQRRAVEEATRQAEEAQAAKAAQADKAKSDNPPASSDSESGASSSSGSAAVPPAASTDTADWSSDEDAFVSQWTARIDNYLAGSPLSGYGETFARAAWTYGVDPRWSPAISCVESTKGAYCFASHNAWGWGSVSWDSWEEAINAHVAGLARGYGYTLTYAAAQKYCPPNADHWYNSCLAQMNSI